MKLFKAISLIVLLLTSQIGIAMTTHQCEHKGTTHEIQLPVQSKKHCEDMPIKQMPCEGKEKAHHPLEKPCCSNEVQTFQVEDDYLTHNFEQDIHPQFAIAFAYTLSDNLSLTSNQQPQIQNYFPPPPESDLNVLFQIFRI